MTPTGATGPVGYWTTHRALLETINVTAFQTNAPLSRFTPTLGEHLRKKRIDLSLSMTQLAAVLGLGVTDTAIEKWEKNQNRPKPQFRQRILEFLGYDPAMTNPTGNS